MNTRLRGYRSPYRTIGWVALAVAATGTIAFFLGVDWSGSEGSQADYLNLSKVPITAGLLIYLGLHPAVCRVTPRIRTSS